MEPVGANGDAIVINGIGEEFLVGKNLTNEMRAYLVEHMILRKVMNTSVEEIIVEFTEKFERGVTRKTVYDVFRKFNEFHVIENRKFVGRNRSIRTEANINMFVRL